MPAPVPQVQVWSPLCVDNPGVDDLAVRCQPAARNGRLYDWATTSCKGDPCGRPYASITSVLMIALRVANLAARNRRDDKINVPSCKGDPCGRPCASKTTC